MFVCLNSLNPIQTIYLINNKNDNEIILIIVKCNNCNNKSY